MTFAYFLNHIKKGQILHKAKSAPNLLLSTYLKQLLDQLLYQRHNQHLLIQNQIA